MMLAVPCAPSVAESYIQRSPDCLSQAVFEVNPMLTIPERFRGSYAFGGTKCALSCLEIYISSLLI